MKNKLIFYLAFCIAFVLNSCYPDDTVYYKDLDVVYTNYEDDFDFASKRTYAMPDKIVKITGNLVEGEDPEFVKEPQNTQVLDRIKTNMTAMGYTLTVDPADADLVLFPAVWTNTTVYYWYDYWCWYYPYYCGYGWGYSGYTTSYTTGTLVMTLTVDGADYIDPATVWTAVANGLLSGEYTTTRVNNAIDQAFKQSPYLKTE